MRLIDANALAKHIKDLPTWWADDGGVYPGGSMKYPDGMYYPEDIISSIDNAPSVDAVEVVHGRWEYGICSNCKKEAFSTSWDEPIYDYDWEENLRYSYTETHTEHILTDYCPNCGAKMNGGNDDGNL